MYSLTKVHTKQVFSSAVLDISTGWYTLHELGTERGVCTNQKIVPIRILSEQVARY